VIAGPVTFWMGSPPGEVGRVDVETLHQVRIGRTFLLSAKPVTVAEYRKFNASHGVGEIEKHAPTDECPVVNTSWFQAAAYCNWLSKQEGLPECEWCYEPVAEPGFVPG